MAKEKFGYQEVHSDAIKNYLERLFLDIDVHSLRLSSISLEENQDHDSQTAIVGTVSGCAAGSDSDA